jgi:hypothetical protein
MLASESRNVNKAIFVQIDNQHQRLHVAMPFTALQLGYRMDAAQVVQINTNKSGGMHVK